jgi:hypothetical protein
MRARISVSLLLVCLSLGCGSSGELAPDAGAEGGAPDGTDAASEEDVVGAGFCTPGADQTCNDDPSVSALEGTCHRLGFCECNEGYSLNWNTNRCRVGTECVASAADDWQYRMPLDAADCASRAPTACSNGTSLLTSDVDSLMSTTCRLPNDLWIRIELADGCPRCSRRPIAGRRRSTTTRRSS